MKAMHSNPTRKRAVNLTLNEALVSQAKQVTNNLSGVVEQLLADYVRRQYAMRQEKLQTAERTAKGWNAFNEHFASFADEHSTL